LFLVSVSVQAQSVTVYSDKESLIYRIFWTSHTRVLAATPYFGLKFVKNS